MQFFFQVISFKSEFPLLLSKLDVIFLRMTSVRWKKSQSGGAECHLQWRKSSEWQCVGCAVKCALYVQFIMDNCAWQHWCSYCASAVRRWECACAEARRIYCVCQCWLVGAVGWHWPHTRLNKDNAKREIKVRILHVISKQKSGWLTGWLVGWFYCTPSLCYWWLKLIYFYCKITICLPKVLLYQVPNKI